MRITMNALKPSQRGGWAPTVALLIALIAGPAARAIDNSCYWRVTGTSTITTYGEIINPDGSKTYVPMGGVTYYYYTYHCDPDTGEYYDDGATGGGELYIPMKPKVSLKTINTTDPYRPLLIVNVASDPHAPATTLKTSVAGSVIGTQPLVGDGQYELVLRSVNDYAPSSTARQIVVSACTAQGSCGSATGSMTRFRPPYLSQTTSMPTMGLSGDEFFFHTYGHQFLQQYVSTSFSIPELAQTSRRQLRNSIIKIQTSVQNYKAAFDGRVKTTGTLYSTGYTVTPSCYDVPTCYGYCAHKCGDGGAFGFMVSAQDHVVNVMLTNFTAMSVSSGASLTHDIP